MGNYHNYDVWQIYYRAIKQGRKPFHIVRYSNVQVGDEICFNEITPEKQYTGNKINAIVTYVHKGSDLLDGRFLLGFRLINTQDFQQTILSFFDENRNEETEWLFSDYLNKINDIEMYKEVIEKLRKRLDWVIGKTTDHITKHKLESIAQEAYDMVNVGVNSGQFSKMDTDDKAL